MSEGEEREEDEKIKKNQAFMDFSHEVIIMDCLREENCVTECTTSLYRAGDGGNRAR